MPAETDRTHMQRALQLAERGWGCVHPNPMVGAVVARGATVIGEGWHGEFGGPHAEIVALRAAGERARGATLYVTLEPCAHHGKTPPCTTAVREAGIRRVVFATADRNPQAAGGGAVLAEAGIEVEGGLLAAQAWRLNAAFHHIHESGTPWLALKLAISLDGRIAAAPGRRTAISGPEAADWVHWLRAGFDAVMVGRRTAAVDDPLLTVRGPLTPRRPPVRVVVDSTAALRPDSALARSSAEAPVWVLARSAPPVTRAASLETAGVRVLSVDAPGGEIDLRQAVTSLWREGIRSILCEGGGRLAGSLLTAGLVQRIYLVVAPIVIGETGVAAFPAGIAGDWRVCEGRQLGRDGLLVLEPEPGRG